MDEKKATIITVSQLKDFLVHLPDGIILEISWEDPDGEE